MSKGESILEPVHQWNGIGDVVVTQIQPSDPCTYCGHKECGDGSPLDSAHLTRYCSTCWSENRNVQMTARPPSNGSHEEVLEAILTELKTTNELRQDQIAELRSRNRSRSSYQPNPPTQTTPLAKPKIQRRG